MFSREKCLETNSTYPMQKNKDTETLHCDHQLKS